MTFSFKRRIGYYIIQVYFPDMFVVALSWIVFWMDKDDMGNRMALGITTILTIMFLLGSLNGTLPKVSYPKALDWYLLISFTFVFFAMVECMIVFVLTLSASEDKEKIKCKVCVLQLIDARPSLGSRMGYLSFEHAHSSSNGSMRLLSLNRPLSDCHFME